MQCHRISKWYDRKQQRFPSKNIPEDLLVLPGPVFSFSLVLPSTILSCPAHLVTPRETASSSSPQNINEALVTRVMVSLQDTLPCLISHVWSHMCPLPQPAPLSPLSPSIQTQTSSSSRKGRWFPFWSFRGLCCVLSDWNDEFRSPNRAEEAGWSIFFNISSHKVWLCSEVLRSDALTHGHLY